MLHFPANRPDGFNCEKKHLRMGMRKMLLIICHITDNLSYSRKLPVKIRICLKIALCFQSAGSTG